MLNLESYRSSTDYREILRILQKASTTEENIVWQSHALGKNVINIHHLEIDFVAREVVIYFNARRYEVDKELPIYVKLDYRSSVFKISDYRQGMNSIHFSFPVELKTQELRTKPRHQFDVNTDKAITIKPSITAGGKDTAPELTVRVFDVSESGIGLMVSEQNRSYLKNNRILWLTKLGGETLANPLLAEIVYINNEIDPKFQKRKQKDLKVGLKLSGTLPTDIYNKFIQ